MYCGASWAFSVVETMESYRALLPEQGLLGFSIQQLLDCAGYYCNLAAWPTDGYDYIKKVGGLEPAVFYPYYSLYGNTTVCKFTKKFVFLKLKNFYSLKDEKAMYNHASSVTGGPISVCCHGAYSWSGYQGGVIDYCGWDNTTDQCLQITGYQNHAEANAYWMVRNSWGPSWGEYGYIYFRMGGNVCGVANFPTYPEVEAVIPEMKDLESANINFNVGR